MYNATELSKYYNNSQKRFQRISDLCVDISIILFSLENSNNNGLQLISHKGKND